MNTTGLSDPSEVMAGEAEARELRRELARLALAERAHARVLEAMVRNEAPEVALVALARWLELRLPGEALSVFMVAGEDLRHVSGCGLPEELARYFSAHPEGIGQVGPGECKRQRLPLGWTLEPDRDWAFSPEGSFAAACSGGGISGGWSVPMLAAQGDVLGVVTAYRRVGGGETLPESKVVVLEDAAVLATLGLEQRRLCEKLGYHAHYDALTALPNRTLFHHELSGAIRGARYEAKSLAVLRVDVNRFSQLQDTLGTRVGDLVLKQTAARLRQYVRNSDCVARVGGNEFAIFLREPRGAEGAMRAAENILAAFENPLRLGEQEYVVSVSIGISLYPEHGKNYDELTRNADIAVVSARQQGRHGAAVFTAESETRVRDRFSIELHLRRALERKELELNFQPQVRWGQPERYLGVEALLRWHSGALGRVGPDRFIPVAEASGQILGLGQWALEEACRTAARWERLGRPLRMAVNVAGDQFSRRDFVSQVGALLAETGLEAGMLELELTESSVLRDGSQCLENMRQFRKLGVRLAIDDFGTGYSSLSYLHSMPVNAVKVDRSFVQELATNAASARLVESIIQLAKALQLEVVAEGVETEEQYAMLGQMGCDLIQGYYVARPMPVEQVEIALRP
jgi:diguanylate cyclase (GGDEF)-like protein